MVSALCSLWLWAEAEVEEAALPELESVVVGAVPVFQESFRRLLAQLLVRGDLVGHRLIAEVVVGSQRTVHS